jgi:DNA-directed RNA polymerase specialized sigma24 family protein
MNQVDDAFRTLYDENARAVQSFFVRLGVNREESKDLAQDTFLRAYRSLESETVREPGRSWLLT